jgi:hypothetical protein
MDLRKEIWNRSWTAFTAYWRALFGGVLVSLFMFSFLFIVPQFILAALRWVLPREFGAFIYAYERSSVVDAETGLVTVWWHQHRYDWACVAVHVALALVFAALSQGARSRERDPSHVAVIPTFGAALKLYISIVLESVAVLALIYVLPYVAMGVLRRNVLPSYVDAAFRTKVCADPETTETETHMITAHCCSNPYELLSIPAFHAGLSLLLALLAPARPL